MSGYGSRKNRKAPKVVESEYDKRKRRELKRLRMQGRIPPTPAGQIVKDQDEAIVEAVVEEGRRGAVIRGRGTSKVKMTAMLAMFAASLGT